MESKGAATDTTTTIERFLRKVQPNAPFVGSVSCPGADRIVETFLRVHVYLLQCSAAMFTCCAAAAAAVE